MKKIDLKKPKYVYATIIYVGTVVLAWIITGIHIDKKPGNDDNLQTTEYFNSDLPDANVPKDIGSKRANVKRMYGDITDRTAMRDFVEDIDSVNKKEDFTSQYSEEELKLLEEQKLQQEEIARLKELNETLRKQADKGSEMASTDFSLDISDEERQRIMEMRRTGMMADMERDLGNIRSRAVSEMGSLADLQDSIINSHVQSGEVIDDEKAVTELSEDSESQVVIKKSRKESEYFNTLSENEVSDNLIQAIIDENIKAVDGSRVRLRLLDDIEIAGTPLPKGSYLYAIMSGFGSQRVKGKVSSVLIGDEIIKISLSIYDVDGLEGLYVPQSSFRETAKDVGGSVMEGNMSFQNNYGASSLSQWAFQGLQNAYQRTSNAISKNIRKNRAKLKYGTKVYLVNGQSGKKQRN